MTIPPTPTPPSVPPPPRVPAAPAFAPAPVPPPARRWGKLWPILGLGVSGLYLLNPGFGVFELLPDNLPGVGNLDEGGAVLLFIACLRRLRS